MCGIHDVHTTLLMHFNECTPQKVFGIIGPVVMWLGWPENGSIRVHADRGCRIDLEGGCKKIELFSERPLFYAKGRLAKRG